MSGASDGILRAFLGYDMKRAFAAIQADVNAALGPLGLRMLTFSVLAMVRDNPAIRQSHLAEVLMIERPNLVLILDELEGADLLTRVRARDDRRAFELTVTLKGRRLCDKALAAVSAHDARMAMGLSDAERDALQGALRRIERNGRGSQDARQVSRP